MVGFLLKPLQALAFTPAEKEGTRAREAPAMISDFAH
jgi:hypothetical protein